MNQYQLDNISVNIIIAGDNYSQAHDIISILSLYSNNELFLEKCVMNEGESIHYKISDRKLRNSIGYKHGIINESILTEH